MSTWQPSPAAQRLLDDLVVRVIDWGELEVHRNTAGVSFDPGVDDVGAVQADGSMVFGDSVGRAFETAGERPQSLSDAEVAELRHAIRHVTFTTLDKRHERLGPAELREFEPGAGAGDAADRFLNDGLRHADWAVSGDRICFRLSPELGSRLRDVQEGEPENRVARDAGLALADQYAKARGEWLDTGIRELLETPRDQVFEKVVDAKLAAQLRDQFEPAQEGLAGLRARLTSEVRAEFEQLAAEPHLETSAVQAQVGAVCGRVDESARTVKESLAAIPGRQPGTRSPDQAKPSGRHGWTGFGRRTGAGSER
ncbi:MAG TPA: hypothetical protein VFH76_09785 [Kribbella sp.]|nr:hypothetical protein [Kribbella sp.]